MNHTEIWNVARKLKLGNAFYEGLDTLLDKIETDSEPLNIASVDSRRELLIGFAMNNLYDQVSKENEAMIEAIVDTYLANL